MASQLATQRSIFVTSQILQLAIINVDRCRSSAISSLEWTRIPHQDFLRILNVAVENSDCEFEVHCHSDDFIRAHGRAGVLFRAGSLKAASAHELAARIRADFLERAFQGNLRDQYIDSDSPEELIQRLDRQLEEEEASLIWSEFRELPEFDSGELAIQMQTELAFVSANPPSDDWSDWIYTAEARRRFGFDSPQGWTTFANELRDQGLLKNHPQSGAKRVKIHRSVFTSRGVPFSS